MEDLSGDGVKMEKILGGQQGWGLEQRGLVEGVQVGAGRTLKPLYDSTKKNGKKDLMMML